MIIKPNIMFFLSIGLKISAYLGNSNKPPWGLFERGAYLSKSVLGVGGLSREGLIREWWLNRSFTVHTIELV